MINILHSSHFVHVNSQMYDIIQTNRFKVDISQLE